MQEEPIIRDGALDSQNLCFYDPEYRWISVLLAIFLPARSIGESEERRMVNSAKSVCPIRSTISVSGSAQSRIPAPSDFLHWQPLRANCYQHHIPLEHFYTNATFLCPGAEQLYISMPMRFMYDRHKVASCPFPGVSDGVFMTSRDGVRFDRTFLEGWLRPELDERCWTQRNYITAWGMLETSAEEFSIFVNEHYEWDDACLRRYAIRRHGFASPSMRPMPVVRLLRSFFRFTGNQLTLNYATSAAGGIRVGILATAPAGRPAILRLKTVT